MSQHRGGILSGLPALKWSSYNSGKSNVPRASYVVSARYRGSSTPQTPRPIAAAPRHRTPDLRMNAAQSQVRTRVVGTEASATATAASVPRS